MSKKIIIYLILFFAFNNVKSQDIHFSQFNENPMMLNPAYAGYYKGDFRAYINYKDQWASISNVYKTYAVSADFILFKNTQKKKLTGIGLSSFQDIAGASKTKTSRIDLNLSQTIYLNENSDLSLGIGITYMELSANYAGLAWGTQYSGIGYDNTLPTLESFTGFGKRFVDFSAGLLYSYISEESKMPFEVGLSVYHLTQPNIGVISSTDILSMKYTLNINKEIKITNESYGLHLLAYITNQATAREFNIGFLMRASFDANSKLSGFYNDNKVYFGGFYRIGDAIILMSKFQFNKNYTVGLSYDVNISRLNVASRLRGGPEVSFSYTGTIFNFEIQTPRFLMEKTK